MQITKRIKNELEILAIKGELDLNNAAAVKTILDREINAGKINIVMDLKGLEYIDSSGIGVFINTVNKIRSLKGNFFLLGLNDNIKRIFNLTKLTFFFRIVRDEMELDLISRSAQSSAPSPSKSPLP